MAGVIRPYTIFDILNTINEQSAGDTGNPIVNTTDAASVVAVINEVDETITIVDTTFTGVLGSVTWDQGAWNAATWG